MTATILSFGRRQPQAAPLPSKMPWQNQDLAELYRVRDRLCAAGLDVEVEAGVSDEGDPWFVYCQAGTDNVVVHIARIDFEIHVVNCVTGGAYVGTSFREVSDQMLEDAPIALGANLRRSSNVVLHPSAFLTAFVAAAIMLVDLLEHGRAEAAEHKHGDAHHPAHDGASQASWLITGHAPEKPHSAEAHDGAPLRLVEGETADAGGALQRRITKEGPTAQTAAPSTVTPALAVPVAAPGMAPHGGPLADVSNSAASFVLTAGMFVAELLRVFHEEDRAHGTDWAGAGFGQDFGSLLTGFLSEGAAKSAHQAGPAGDAPVLSLFEGVGTALAGDPASSPVQIALGGHAVAVAPLHPAEKPAEPVHLSSFAPHDPGFVFPEKALLELRQGTAMSSSSAAGQHAAEAAVQALPETAIRTPEAAPVATTLTGPAAPPVAVQPVKEIASADIDLDWVVSQVVKHAGATVAVFGVEAPRPQAEPAPSSDPSDVTPAPDPAKADAAPTPSASLGLVETVSHAGEHLTSLLVAGQAETVRYEKGSFLTVEHFTLGEDILFFADGSLGDAMSNKAHAEGTDLVLGDAETGTVRLVGVLSDPSILSHHAGTTSAAA